MTIIMTLQQYQVNRQGLQVFWWWHCHCLLPPSCPSTFVFPGVLFYHFWVECIEGPHWSQSPQPCIQVLLCGSNLFFKKILFLFMFMCVSVYMPHVCRSEESIRYRGAGTRGSCELPDMGFRNWTQVLQKTYKIA